MQIGKSVRPLEPEVVVGRPQGATPSRFLSLETFPQFSPEGQSPAQVINPQGNPFEFIEEILPVRRIRHVSPVFVKTQRLKYPGGGEAPFLGPGIVRRDCALTRKENA